MRKNKGTLVLVLLVAAGLILMGYNRFANWGPRGGAANMAGSGAVPCINPAIPIPPEYHIHPHLRIVSAGEDGGGIKVPANIGLSVTCERVLHTHDDTGTIHIEPNFYQEFTLGQFFGVWGTPFSKGGYEAVMTVDGKPSPELQNLVLKDKQEIVLEYKKVSGAR